MSIITGSDTRDQDVENLRAQLATAEAKIKNLKNAIDSGQTALRRIQKFAQTKPIREMATDGLTHIADHLGRRL